MKFVGFTLALTLLAGAVGLSFRAGPLGIHVPAPTPPPQASLALDSAGKAGNVLPENGAARVDSAAPADRTAPADSTARANGTPWGTNSSEEPEPENPRRRRRSRYPGPIPTPEEWEPPEGPVRIGLQAGHWKAGDAPSELAGIRDNGTRWADTHEWEVNLGIARKTQELLEALGYEVDLLPAVVPPGYRAHLFISIHADGSADSRASGFRVASPRRDATGRAAGFAEILKESYARGTKLARLPDATHRMQNYYTFNFRRYEHALHPMTIGVIIETGFLTSEKDREVLMDDPETAARAIASAVEAFPETPPPGADASRSRSSGGS